MLSKKPGDAVPRTKNSPVNRRNKIKMSDTEKPKDEAKQDESEPTIKVDDDWKEQVETEKNADSNDETEVQDTNETEQSPPHAADSEDESAANPMPEPPPASFSVLVTMLFTQAMAMLGQMPDPNTGEAKVNKPFAKHYIDTLEMLESKTKGNLDEQETAMLNEALHALRMMYVDTRS